jgi:hypothetical protein
MGDDAVRLADDLRQRARDMTAAASAETHEQIEARLAASERRTEASEAQARKLHADLIELQQQARDSTAKMIDDLRRCGADLDLVKADKAVASLRVEVGDKFATLREHVADVVENRPAFDQSQVDRAVEPRSRGFSLTCARRRTQNSRRSSLSGSVRSKIAALEERLRLTTGELPQVRNWKPETVYYSGELVACDGASWQARKDSATAPGSTDWTLIARAGRVGRHGASVTPRGEWDEHDAYSIRASVPSLGDRRGEVSRDRGVDGRVHLAADRTEAAACSVPASDERVMAITGLRRARSQAKRVRGSLCQRGLYRRNRDRVRAARATVDGDPLLDSLAASLRAWHVMASG